MKVLHVVDKLNVGGAEKVIVNLSNIFEEHGQVADIICLLEEGSLNKEVNKGVNQFFLHRKYRFSIISFLKFYRIIRNYDILHVHMRHNLRYVVLCRYLFFSIRFPIIAFQDHTGFLSKSFLLKRILKKADCYIGVSEKNVQWARETLKIKKTFLLPNIVRKQTYSHDYDKINRCIMVGNIRPEKNYPFIFELCKKMGIAIDIYGNYSNEDYFKDVLKQKIDSVTIISNKSNIQELIGRYQMAFHCAPRETGPLVLIEYLAQGLPFISFNTGEVIHQIKSELPGFVVDSFDINEWINATEHLRRDIKEKLPELRDQMTRVFNKYYSEEKYYQSCMRIYKKSQAYY